MARPFDRLFTPQHKLGSASARLIRWRRNRSQRSERITKIAILIECFVADFIVACAAARIKDSYQKQKSIDANFPDLREETIRRICDLQHRSLDNP
jgi:hypothetical protein